MKTETAVPTIGNGLASELAYEATLVKKLIERLPAEQFEWRPHEKSMTLGKLANHVVETFEWTNATINQDVLDFATRDYQPGAFETSEKLSVHLDEVVQNSVDMLNNVSDEDITKIWTMRNGEEVYMELPKVAVVRSFVLNHMIHHRGQLSVYLRLLDVPVPQIYGPSADEPDM